MDGIACLLEAACDSGAYPAVDAGGRLLMEPSSPPWGGVRGYFADPDGFTWEIAWNPATTIDEDGRVHLNQSDDA